MTQATEFEPPRTAEAEVAATDRRRPGRVRNVSPELIPLLRGEESPSDDPPPQFGNPDQLDGVRGIAVGALLSAPMWVCIALVGRWFFR